MDSTTGVQMAYLKSWARRSFNDIQLRLPAILPRPQHGRCKSYRLDAVDAAGLLDADLAYIDPPYNQHSYLGNYHIWETLVLWDRPEHYGIAHKRLDCRTRKSDFNSRPKAKAAFSTLISNLRSAVLYCFFQR